METMKHAIAAATAWTGGIRMDSESMFASIPLKSTMTYLTNRYTPEDARKGKWLIVSADACPLPDKAWQRESIDVGWHAAEGGQGGKWGADGYVPSGQKRIYEVYDELFAKVGMAEGIADLRKRLEAETGHAWFIAVVGDLKTLLCLVHGKAANADRPCLYCDLAKTEFLFSEHSHVLEHMFTPEAFRSVSLVEWADVVIYCPGHQVAQGLTQVIHAVEQFVIGRSPTVADADAVLAGFRGVVQEFVPHWRTALRAAPTYERGNEDCTLGMKEAICMLKGESAWGSVLRGGHRDAPRPSLIPRLAEALPLIDGPGLGTPDAKLPERCRCGWVRQYWPDEVVDRQALRVLFRLVCGMMDAVISTHPPAELKTDWVPVGETVKVVWRMLCVPSERFLQPLHLLVDHTAELLQAMGRLSEFIQQWLERQHPPDQALWSNYAQPNRCKDGLADFCVQCMARECTVKGMRMEGLDVSNCTD